jgi:hypothetical protein
MNGPAALEDPRTDWVKQTSAVPYATHLAQRLAALTAIAEEEAPDQAPLRTESLRGLVAFLSALPSVAEPDLVLTADGDLRARWRQDATHHLAVTFLNGQDVHYVLFAPDPAHPYKTARVSGRATVDTLMEVVAPYGVSGWLEAAGTGGQTE